MYMRTFISLILVSLLGLAIHLNPYQLFGFPTKTTFFMKVWFGCLEVFIIPLLLAILGVFVKKLKIIALVYGFTMTLLSLGALFEIVFRSLQLNTWSLLAVVGSFIFSFSLVLPKPKKKAVT